MNIAQRIDEIYNEMTRVAHGADRPADAVRLVAVSKRVNLERIREAVAAGQRTFGENYVQEAREKITAMTEHPLSWHMIGRLQSNKANLAVGLFDLIHSVDSLKLARAIAKAAARINKVQDILIQVNMAADAAKAGVASGDAIELVRDAAGMDHLRVIGLMTMPPFFDDPNRARPIFSALRELMDRINAQGIAGNALTELSMGMSGDMAAGITEGATLVRVGTAIFGERS